MLLTRLCKYLTRLYLEISIFFILPLENEIYFSITWDQKKQCNFFVPSPSNENRYWFKRFSGHLSTLQKLYQGISEIFTTFFEKLQWSQKNWMRYFFTLQRGGTRYCIQRYYLGVSVDECDNIFTHIDFQS